MVKKMFFEIKDCESGYSVGLSTTLPRASAVYELAEKTQRPLAVYVGGLKLLDTRTLQKVMAEICG